MKLKADSIAMVLLCLLRHMWMYIAGWKDGKAKTESSKTHKKNKKKKKEDVGGSHVRRVGRRGKGMGKKNKGVIVVRGRYTLVLR